ncbi:hypothetical protein C8F04DRAFT_1262565 [Mycena alexandri]|uniref:F-box domain-containing protein n=1 Tax=Mycena alexandri TaxID=1745969 RepID=A0AAD6SQT5_9AGAR|nr:hypothetical protein C8F04DRAFT_1262565 [Mycena alexandri]
MSSPGVGHPQSTSFDQVQTPSTSGSPVPKPSFHALSTNLYARAGHVRPAAPPPVRRDPGTFGYSVDPPFARAIPPPALSVFEDFELSLHQEQRRFLAEQVNHTVVDLIFLALQVGWCAGWRAHCATKIPHRHFREFADIGTQTEPTSLNLPKRSSTVAPLPQELVDAIVSEVADPNSLKACALASLSFRGPSQRALHSSLTLHGHQDSAVREFLTTSPHITLYVTKLKMKLPPPHAPFSEFDSLEWILSKLTRVNRCVITGIYTHSSDELCRRQWKKRIKAFRAIGEFDGPP